jgi:hypothetical protein
MWGSTSSLAQGKKQSERLRAAFFDGRDLGRTSRAMPPSTAASHWGRTATGKEPRWKKDQVTKKKIIHQVNSLSQVPMAV